ncbi:hypothetical protein BKI52_44170 [marine bacterium AO1-C]|nr:hypothetical protein BKI52_44170 [marine bacterium AO1-C]
MALSIIIIVGILLTCIGLYDALKDDYENFSPLFWILNLTAQVIIMNFVTSSPAHTISSTLNFIAMPLAMWVVVLACILGHVIQYFISDDTIQANLDDVADIRDNILRKITQPYRYIKQPLSILYSWVLNLLRAFRPPSPHNFPRQVKAQPVVKHTIHSQSPVVQLKDVQLLKRLVKKSFDRFKKQHKSYNHQLKNNAATQNTWVDVFVESHIWMQQLDPFFNEIESYHQQSNQLWATVETFRGISRLNRLILRRALRTIGKLVTRFNQSLTEANEISRKQANDAIQKDLGEVHQFKIELLTQKQVQFHKLQEQYQQMKKTLEQQITTPWQKLKNVLQNPFEAVFWLFGNQETLSQTLEQLQAQVKALKQQVTQQVQELEQLKDQISRVGQNYQEASQTNGKALSIWVAYDLLNTDDFWDKYEGFINQMKPKQQAMIQHAS